MTVINGKDFITNQNEHFDLAINEQVYIENDENMFQFSCTDFDNTVVKERVYYEPDEDFYRSITIDEFLERALEMIERVDKKYSKK